MYAILLKSILHCYIFALLRHRESRTASPPPSSMKKARSMITTAPSVGTVSQTQMIRVSGGHEKLTDVLGFDDETQILADGVPLDDLLHGGQQQK